MHSEAGAASRREDHAAGFDEDAHVACVHGLQEYPFRGWRNNEPGIRADFLVAEYACGQGEVFKPAVGAGTQEDLMYAYAFKVFREDGVIYGVRAGNRRFQFRGVYLDDPFVDRVLVW